MFKTRECRCGHGRILAGDRQSFWIPQAKRTYGPDRPFLLRHTRLELKTQPVLNGDDSSLVGRVEGRVTHRLEAVGAGASEVVFSQEGLTFHGVQVDGKAADFRVREGSLTVHLPHRASAGTLLEVTVTYLAENPERGIYFIAPDGDEPEKIPQIWTQSQDEDSRYWYPSLDHPAQKGTFELLATVPERFTALSNGTLLKKTPAEKGWCTYHYGTDYPLAPYLTTLVVGEFDQWEDQGPRGLPVQYFVAPGRKGDGERAFSGTPLMIEAFEKKLGVPYPYDKYAQVAVQDFIFGGMENTSATTQTDRVLMDSRAALDHSADFLVAHELAHQWFGDYVTCRDWDHAWLNEGFATFFERVWVENKKGDGGGWDEAKYLSYVDLKEHLGEDRGSYRRPVVCNTFVEPIDLFDTHIYQKGGLVVNLLRYWVGEDLFWKSIRHYLETHAHGSVETVDLIRAFEKVTGRNLRRVFDEWIFGAGYPELEASYAWHPERKGLEITVEQKQTGGKSESRTDDGWTTHLFHLPLMVDLHWEDGKKESHVMTLGELRDRTFIPCSVEPKMIRLDPDFWIPKTLKFPRPQEMLVYQLSHDPDIMGRIQALKDLAQKTDPKALGAVAQAVAQDSFWGVKAEAAEILKKWGTPAAQEALLKALDSADHPKARRAIVSALGNFRDPQVAERLRKFAEQDETYGVEAAATEAWSLSRAHQKGTDPDETEAFLMKQLAKPSFNDLIRRAALKGLADLPGMGRGLRPAALNTLIEWTERGRGDDARSAALEALGELVKMAMPPVRSRIFAQLDRVAVEKNFRIRMVLIRALNATGSLEAVPLLERISLLDSDGRIKRRAQRAAEALRRGADSGESLGEMRERLLRLEKDHEELKAKLDQWVTRLEKGDASP